MPKEGKIAIQEESPSNEKSDLWYPYPLQGNFHYLNIHMSLLLSIILITAHLKIKTGFGVGHWLFFSKSKYVIKRNIQFLSYQEPSDMEQK